MGGLGETVFFCLFFFKKGSDNELVGGLIERKEGVQLDREKSGT